MHNELGMSPPSTAIRRRAGQYARFIERHAGAVIVGFLLLTAFFALSLRRLELRTSFEDLLPDGQPSVTALHEIVERVGGVGTLNVAIESEDKEASKRFARDLAAALQIRMAKDLHTIDWTMAPVRRFFEKNGVLYLKTEELRELESTLTEAIRRAKLKANPLYADLEEDDGAKKEDPAAGVRELEQKLRKHAGAADKFPEGFYIGENGKLLAIFLRPSGSALEIHGARELIGKLRRVVDGLDPRRYHPSMKVNFTGSVQVNVEEHQAIARDLASTSFLCIALVALAVWLYFRRVRVLALLGVTLVSGAIWSFGLAALTSGAVNAQTAFLGSIIVGTGINYGIMILARYLEERREGRGFSEALATALAASFRPTLVAGLATGVAFGVLGVAHIRSFSQFGFIGGLGIVICWALSYTALPALLVLFERVSWLRLRAVKKPRLTFAYPSWLAELPVRHAWAVTAISAVLVVISVVAIVRTAPRSLETDMNNIRNKSSVETGTNVLDNRIGAMMGDSLHPAVVLADGPHQARRICEAYDRLRERHAKRPPVEWCRSIHSLLPEQQQEKLAIVASIRERLDKTPRDLLPDDVRSRLDELRARLEVRALVITDIPDELRRRFRDKNGTEGVIALVAPGAQLGLYVIDDLYAYSDALREVRLDSGEMVHSSNEQVIFADILRTIAIDAPRTTVLAAGGVLLMLMIVLRRPRSVGLVGGALLAGVTLMAGIAAIFGVRYNFLNFVALPTTFGIGVDYAVNIHERQAQDGPGSSAHALRRTGPAVFVASLTTIIGYGVLMTSNSMALVSFGKLAVIGELTCLAGALLLLPGLTTLSERRPQRSLAPAAELESETRACALSRS
jgi:hypothetical protein